MPKPFKHTVKIGDQTHEVEATPPDGYYDQEEVGIDIQFEQVFRRGPMGASGASPCSYLTHSRHLSGPPPTPAASLLNR